ncbi:MAG: hypothetical protein UR39_C0001G0048 [Candidatus Woesebacteria bacterium GW2011_GWA1_33_30]|uniref:SCP domain-containing protein n=1 Tax=Candidatus Woesebacteria bacterium GW2011_GWA2_33_28 TaxID=1618561 RepID=A0A0F9ZV15_9BACT|nr:MAG: hypothetical protein UR38_C0001G0049 [Candidatus Woesebacteria bacterium GW2011_GWA2_33_28]KKP49015.1 MAG: hypothetical protein UR39_C0001G0048 [Candidatus Woesebacteria bacterium GW2011_GWA1_33_30]KKP49877.1 MAG: hypothetical protein UR40_C0003G0049 [Microgenomates group bacterium GW2011_GWC1_33_32]KKP52607.1 MAG: hypothetical protein UR44_C0001G0049 [Candidatus Woesebacteria bacterium GW2011_GWB1_33_38]KKP56266.1 MAG: hypothetical protein UR48_C0037G0004 [Microgenomates group bacteriu
MEKLIHLFIPRQSNNHKAKILHSSSLIVIASFFVVFQALINFLPRFGPNILGYASQISPDEVTRLTNQKRAEAGLSALTYNQTLAGAAYTKGRDMIDRDYWAHTAPDGTQPWKFFTDFGYRYKYAGENLARDFSSAQATVDAWMNSPTHRDNILNSKYKEIGIGVTEGDLAGIDTTIVVQFFGATYQDKVSEPVAQVQQVKTPVPTLAPTIVPVTTNLPQVQAEITSPQPNQQVLISPFNTTRFASIAVVLLLLFVFVLDAFLVSRRRIIRVAGRTFAHVAFLGMILTVILILRSGKIL